MGNNEIGLDYIEEESYYTIHVIHSAKYDNFAGVSFNDEIKDKIIRKLIYKQENDFVQYFDGTNKAIGIVFLEFSV